MTNSPEPAARPGQEHVPEPRAGDSAWWKQTMLGAIWSNLSFIATRALSTLWLLILARLLAPSEFGVFAIVTIYLGLSELISDMGMNATVVYEQEAGYTEPLQTAFTLNILVAVVLTVVGFALAGPAAAARRACCRNP